MKELRLKTKLSGSVFLFLIVCALMSSCQRGKGSRYEKKYIVIPSADFVPTQQIKPLYPDCSPDYPLYCAEHNKCCGEGYPFLCYLQDRCYVNEPNGECPDAWEVCKPPDYMITGIDPNDVTLNYSETVNVTVSFRSWSEAPLQKLIINVSGIDGVFERDLTDAELQAGSLEVPIMVLPYKPSLKDCTQACSMSGECGPCYAESIFPEWMIRFFISNGTTYTGTNLEWLNLSVTENPPSQGDQCSDGSECCTPCPDTPGCLITGITVPEECDCPPNTTYSLTDVNYHVKICSCNDC